MKNIYHNTSIIILFILFSSIVYSQLTDEQIKAAREEESRMQMSDDDYYKSQDPTVHGGIELEEKTENENNSYSNRIIENEPITDTVTDTEEESHEINQNERNTIESTTTNYTHTTIDDEIFGTICAYAKPSITGGGEFQRAKFTITGTEPQEIRVTSPAANFAIVNEHGIISYQVIDGISWGSLILVPNTYYLSCSGGGAMGLMSATACIEVPNIGENLSPEMPTISNGSADEKIIEPIKKPILPLGPLDKIFVRPMDRTNNDKLILQVGQKVEIAVWGEDASENIIPNINVDKWELYDDDVVEITDGLGFPVPENEKVKIKIEAGDKVGTTILKATVVNKEYRKISGVLRIEVTERPPVTIEGCVKLYNEDGSPYNAGGVTVGFFGYELTREQYENFTQGILFDERHVITDNNGKFSLKIGSSADFFNFNYGIQQLPVTPQGYYWEPQMAWNEDEGAVYSSRAEWWGPRPKKNELYLQSKSFGCLKYWLKKSSISITGTITYKDNPVEGVEVELVNTMVTAKSDRFGQYSLVVENIPSGNYKITAKRKPKINYKIEPSPSNTTTIHDTWMYINRNIYVDLPFDGYKKTIDIEMISFGEKIGYTGP